MALIANFTHFTVATITLITAIVATADAFKLTASGRCYTVTRSEGRYIDCFSPFRAAIAIAYSNFES